MAACRRVIVVALFLVSCSSPKYLTVQGQPAGAALKFETCQAKFKSGACVTYHWEKAPTDRDLGSMVFKVFRPNLADGSPVVEDLDGSFGILLWMPSMHHGSAPPIVVQRTDVGTYRAANVFFVMRGDWEIHFQLNRGSTIADEAIVPITF